jgi:hypothetical protein
MGAGAFSGAAVAEEHGSPVSLGDLSGATAAEELLSRSPERGALGYELPSDKTLRGKPVRSGILNKLDERLSIIVTDRASTSAITFSEVMGKLADDMGVDRLTLFQRWWDTANKTPRGENDEDRARATNVFCDSETDDVGAGLSLINGFPYLCPIEEKQLAFVNPFNDEVCPPCLNKDACLPCPNMNGFTAIAFSNRFDLADKRRGAHCGEYRIVFAKNSGLKRKDAEPPPTDNRLLIIFEALVPNPDPHVDPDKGPFAKLAGCRPILEFWLSLSNTEMTTCARGKALRDFFLNGLPKDSIAKGLPKKDIGPILNARHYAGGPDSGQIRTNQFMQGRWILREFKTYGGSIVPATVKSNPGNTLISSPATEDPRSRELENYLVSKDALDLIRGISGQMDASAERSPFSFAFALTTRGLDHLNSFESRADLESEGDFVQAVETCRAGGELCLPLEKSIKTELDKAVSPVSRLSPNNVIHRIGTQTCAGCHHYSNGDQELGIDCPEGWSEHGLCFNDGSDRRGIWPSTLPLGPRGFNHVSENEPGESEMHKDVFDLAELEIITLDTLRDIRSKRISHLSYMGPDGNDSRYKISNTLKFVLMPPRFENMVLYLNSFDPP